MSSDDEFQACPSCGGAGGGPFGRAGSAWDTEDYVCPRCKGTGIWAGDADERVKVDVPRAVRGPAVVKAPAREDAQPAKKRASN